MLAPPALRLKLDSTTLVANWRWLAARTPGAACGAAVKADGYGLGANAVVERLADAGCRDFFVATWQEAEALLTLPADIKLSVLHGVRQADLPAALALNAKPVLSSPEQIARWKAAAPGKPCDVMIDTGMNRLGLTPEEAGSGLLGGLDIDTVMSHLACSDEAAHPMNAAQRNVFRKIRSRLSARRYSLANSGGICAGPDYAFDLTRPGLALYGGVQRAEAEHHIAPVVRPEAEVLQVRQVPAGATIGYGATYTAPHALRVAILNLGYADGYFRAFTGNGAVRVAGVLCPLLGRVSMDLIAVDVSTVDVGEGDWLEIEYHLPSAAAATGLSQYELLTGMGSRYQRLWT